MTAVLDDTRALAATPSVASDAVVRPFARWYGRVLLFVDVWAALLATIVAKLARFGTVEQHVTLAGSQIDYLHIGLALVPVWLLVLAARGAYDATPLGGGGDEYRRVLSGGVDFLAVIAVAHFVLGLELARGYAAGAVFLAMVFTFVARVIGRRLVHAGRRVGLWSQRTLLVGDPESIESLVTHLGRNPWAGYAVVGISHDGADVVDQLRATGADTVAVTSWIGPGALRRLAWELEGTGAELLVAPRVTDVAGPRIRIRPVAGLPLLHVEQPNLRGVRLLVKEAVDRTLAAVGLVLASPVLLVAAVLIKATSPGPVFFRQDRVGAGGRVFRIVKLRTMVDGAELRWAELFEHNEGEGLLFKVDRDPRVTPVGRWLRHSCIDELPQLWNVLRGDMSMVGPRPLAVSPDDFQGVEHRRHRVKPGITGLWQVSGRRDLSWEESVRLDLDYVDHWSVAQDLVILLRTVGVVLRRRGAY